MRSATLAVWAVAPVTVPGWTCPYFSSGLVVGGSRCGVQISETCPQCKNDKMSFHTAQLRSADEGQTIFYTCLKCKYVSAVVDSAHCCGKERQGRVARPVVGWSACRAEAWLGPLDQLVVRAAVVSGTCGVGWRTTDGALVPCGWLRLGSAGAFPLCPDAAVPFLCASQVQVHPQLIERLRPLSCFACHELYVQDGPARGTCGVASRSAGAT